MKPSLKKAFALAAMALALVGCENKADIGRKPEVAESMITQSLATCETGPVHGSQAEYAERLRAVLMNQRTADLEAIRDNGVTICLDQRLATQTTGSWDKRIDGVYYNHYDGSRSIVSFWDNGTQPKDASIWHLDAYDHAGAGLSKLAAKLRDGEGIKGSYLYAARYSYHSGKTTHYTTRWKEAKDFDQDSINANPGLKAPPLKAPAPSS
jgi:hypothetical protein